MDFEDNFSRDILVRHGILTLNRNENGLEASYRIVIPFNELYREWEKENRYEETSQGKRGEFEDQAEARVDGWQGCRRSEVEQMEIDPAGETSELKSISSPADSGTSLNSGAVVDEIIVESGPNITGTATEEEPHVCDVCGRPFRRKKDLRRHVLTHSTERPFECPICYVGFKSREYLQRHRRRVHDSECISPEDKRTNGMSFNPQNERQNNGAANFSRKDASQNNAVSILRLDSITARRSDLPLKKRFKPTIINPESDPPSSSNIDPSPIIIDVQNEQALPQSPQREGASPGRGSLPPSPIQQNAGRPKLVGGPFQCETCRSLVPRRFVMVVYLPKPVEKPRIVCKKCFSKKTGLLCID